VIATESPLSQQTCRDRLASSRRGLLACTEGALPSMLPVELRVEDGQLLVRTRKELEGHVVALTVGKTAFRFCRGWNVVARGQLGPPDERGFLPLEIATLDGTTHVRPSPRRRP
jgi:hypothetical protein